MCLQTFTRAGVMAAFSVFQNMTDELKFQNNADELKNRESLGVWGVGCVCVFLMLYILLIL